MRTSLAAIAMLCVAVPAVAQETPQRTDAEWMVWVPTVDQVAMPELVFVEDQEDRDNYEKYYYFTRADTDFPLALSDLRECDAHARGLFRGDWYPDASATAMYGVGGLVGGLIGGVLADAIYGSAQVRTHRRINMRRCMNYKGYQRYGLDKELWEGFNFEEGNGSVPEGDRQQMLAQQALVASQAAPLTQELGL